jgi:hypothetical protein
VHDLWNGIIRSGIEDGVGGKGIKGVLATIAIGILLPHTVPFVVPMCLLVTLVVSCVYPAKL